MSVSQADTPGKPRFNYLICVDLIVLVCILVIAGRPDGLAITVSAVIVCAVAVLYRSVLGIKGYVSNASTRAKAGRRSAERGFGERVQQTPAATRAVSEQPRSKSWLRDSD